MSCLARRCGPVGPLLELRTVRWPQEFQSRYTRIGKQAGPGGGARLTCAASKGGTVESRGFAGEGGVRCVRRRIRTQWHIVVLCPSRTRSEVPPLRRSGAPQRPFPRQRSRSRAPIGSERNGCCRAHGIPASRTCRRLRADIGVRARAAAGQAPGNAWPALVRGLLSRAPCERHPIRQGEWELPLCAPAGANQLAQPAGLTPVAKLQLQLFAPCGLAGVLPAGRRRALALHGAIVASPGLCV